MNERGMKRLLTLREAAEVLAVSPTTLSAWCRTGTPMVPTVRLGRLLRFDPEELRDWVRKRTEYPPRGKVVPFPWRSEEEGDS